MCEAFSLYKRNFRQQSTILLFLQQRLSKYPVHWVFLETLYKIARHLLFITTEFQSLIFSII